MKMARVGLMVVLCVMLSSAVQSYAATSYRLSVIDMTVAAGFHPLGEDGVVAGSVQTPEGDNHPALWDAGQITSLPIDGMVLSRNAVGTSVGIADHPDPGAPFTVPFEWGPDGYTFWPVPAGIQSDQANDINDHGEGVCAFSFPRPPNNESVLTAARCDRTGFDLLPTLGGLSAFARAINNAGLAAGTADTADGRQHIAVWDAQGQVHDYGTLGGPDADLSAFNDAGAFAGVSGSRAFGGDLARGLVPLPHPAGFDTSAAFDLNNHGVRVGTAATTIQEPNRQRTIERAMLWPNEEGQPIDLNGRIDTTAGWTLLAGLGINDAGEILARAVHTSSPLERVVFLSPVDAPPQTTPKLP